jgi:NAD(P)-dependent dehydrogenase (short-subunit alcohol dehydrogenase family)
MRSKGMTALLIRCGRGIGWAVERCYTTEGRMSLLTRGRVELEETTLSIQSCRGEALVVPYDLASATKSGLPPTHAWTPFGLSVRL